MNQSTAKFQYRMRDLAWALSLSAVSFALGAACWGNAANIESSSIAVLFLGCLASGACFGAAAGVLLRKPLVGAIAGAFLAGLLIFAILDDIVIEFGQKHDGNDHRELQPVPEELRSRWERLSPPTTDQPSH